MKHLAMIYRVMKCHLSTDIDECASGIHGCSPDAECKNVNGSYKCSCKLGYSRDGRNCQGKLTVLKYIDNRKYSCYLYFARDRLSGKHVFSSRFKQQSSFSSPKHEEGGENSQQLCKPEKQSRVSIPFPASSMLR